MAAIGSVAIAALVGAQAVGSAYLLLLTTAAALARPKPPGRDGAPRTSFFVIVPAHNEEEMIGATLASLRAQSYPVDLYSVNVIADNCSDATATVAGAAGATVHERHDPAHPGKGQAISWLLQRLREREERAPDAFVFVDADSRLATDFLDTMDRYLAAAPRAALQASYKVENPEASALVSLRAIGFALMHDLRGRGKARLGISCGLWGNGMVIDRAVLERTGWDAFSAVEDAEQHLKLLAAADKVTYVPDTAVYGHMPTSFRAAEGQQVRWEGGRIALARRYWRTLLAATVRQRSASPLAALVELALPPLSVLAVGAVGLTAVALAFASLPVAAVAVVNVAALALYVGVGLLLSGLPPRTYLALVQVPRFIAWKLLLYGRQLMRRTGPAWIRTTRD
jgi:cellulose synthase/poly-beta-1,6-N-acetylglucosamine synthase-like glycosyltransferase